MASAGPDRTLVVGGGVAGLAAAWALRRAGAEVTLLEASDRLGGWVRTEDAEGYRVELGPQGFLEDSPGVMDLLDDLGLRDAAVGASEDSKTRYLLKDDRLVPLPASPPAFLRSPLLSFGGKLRVLREFWAPGPPGSPETIREFATRRIGAEAADVLVDAAVTGIFAGDPAFLSVDACFPKMTEMERDHGGLFRAMRARRRAGIGPKRLFSFRGGMETLTRALAAELGSAARTGTPVMRIRAEASPADEGSSEAAGGGDRWRVETAGGAEAARRLVLAVPPAAAAKLLRNAAPSVAEAAAQVRCASVGVVALGFRREDIGHALDGYGYLVPGGRAPLLGCLFESTVFPERAPEGHALLRVMVGGARNPEALEGTEADIVERTLAALRGPLGLRGAPAFVRTVVHRDAIPQYDRNHPERLRRTAEALRDVPGLTLAGAAWRGVSVNHLAGEAKDLAAKALSS